MVVFGARDLMFRRSTHNSPGGDSDVLTYRVEIGRKRGAECVELIHSFSRTNDSKTFLAEARENLKK